MPPLNRRLVVLTLPLLTACATKYDFLRNYAAPDSGTVVISLGHARSNSMNYSSVYFRAVGTEHLAYFDYNPLYLPDPSPKDFVSNRGEATLIAKKLPPGEYEITSFSTGTDYGTSVVSFRSAAPLGVRFVIKTAEVSYLGQYLVGLELAQVDGKARPVGATLEISNEELRDTGGSKKVAPVAGKVSSFIPRGSSLPPGVRLAE